MLLASCEGRFWWTLVNHPVFIVRICVPDSFLCLSHRCVQNREKGTSHHRPGDKRKVSKYPWEEAVKLQVCTCYNLYAFHQIKGRTLRVCSHNQASPSKKAFHYTCSLTNSPAIPWPVPIHILVTRIFFFVLLASLKTVHICLAPVAPSGCPSAMAPPLGFTFA